MKKRTLIATAWLTGLVIAFELGRGLPSSISEETQSLSSKSTPPANRDRSTSPGLQATRSFAESLQALQKPEDFQALFGVLQPSFENPETHDSLLLLADEWAARHPKAASEWLHKQAFDDPRNPFLFAALSQWAAADGDAALKWLVANYPKASSTRDYLFASFIRGVAQKAPERAWAILNSLPAGPERSGSLDFVLNGWLNQGLPNALDKLENLPATDSPLQIEATQNLLANLPLAELAEAREWAARLSNDEQRKSAQVAIAANWAQHNQGAALEWAGELSDEIRPRALAEVATRWARDSPNEAADWLKQTGPASERDLSNRAISWSLVGLDPEAAFTQIASITNPLLRDETFEQVGRLWLSSTPQQAYQYLQNESPLPSEVRELLLQSYR
ncbi:hypothetical protein AAFN60_07960 [Roseibacillus persicicus]|uniref:hypothetical protein n=1 Tax=Roseibacillus persicicus TaxID=454148 RepID=UPI00398AFAF0